MIDPIFSEFKMSHQNERSVHLAKTMSEAVIIVSTLSMNGIAARVPDEMTLGGIGGLTVFGKDTAGGIEVWVDDPANAEEARAIIVDMKANIIDRAAQSEHRGPIEMDCDRCGKHLKFAGEEWGTVGECPSCGQFLDIGEVEDSIEWDTEPIDENDPELQ